jgi:hypothetical protein
MPARILHRSRDLLMLMRGRELDAYASTYLIKDYARSADEILRDLMVPLRFHIMSLRRPTATRSTGSLA